MHQCIASCILCICMHDACMHHVLFWRRSMWSVIWVRSDLYHQNRWQLQEVESYLSSLLSPWLRFSHYSSPLSNITNIIICVIFIIITYKNYLSLWSTTLPLAPSLTLDSVWWVSMRLIFDKRYLSCLWWWLRGWFWWRLDELQNPGSYYWFNFFPTQNFMK